jgi:hypothetical protein
MITNDRFERTMSSWLHEDATFQVPDHLDEVLEVTKVTRQRPAWSSLERWLPVDTTFRPRFFNVPQPGRVALLAGLIVLLLALAIVAIGSRQQRLPEPFGPARNGQYIASHDGDIYLLDPVTNESRLLPVGDGYEVRVPAVRRPAQRTGRPHAGRGERRWLEPTRTDATDPEPRLAGLVAR